MSSVQPKKVLVAGGTGNMGQNITRELLSKKEFQVFVLSRDQNSDIAKSLSAAGATILVGDPMNASSIEGKLNGIDVVISAVNNEALYQGQLNLVAEAKKAGVKRFYPSEFGIDLTQTDIPIEAKFFGAKFAVIKAIEDAGLEYTRMFVGFFPETTFQPSTWLGFDISSGQPTIPGDGDQKISWTTIPDAARFTVASLQDYNNSKNASISVEGDRLSFNEVIAIYQQIHPNKKVEPKYTTLDELRAILKTQANPFDKAKEQLAVTLANGNALLDEKKIKRYDSVVPMTVKQLIQADFKVNKC